jgi:hypothetical protein
MLQREKVKFRNAWPSRTVGNQADMTSSSIFQSLNIEMNTTMVSLSYPKTEFQKINWNTGKAHQQKYCS